MSEIKCVLFDIGGVLVEWHMSWITSEISERFDIEESKLISAFDKHLKKLDSGKINEKIFWDYIANETNSSLLTKTDESLWNTYFRKNAKPNDEVKKISTSLKQQGFSIGIISNIEKVTHQIVEDWNILENFDYKFMSYEIGYSKPDLEIYEYVLKHLPFSKNELLFIDDKKTNVESAMKCGIHSLHYTSLSDLKISLNSLGL